MRQALIRITLFYLKFWSQVALNIHRPQVIGITGSVGKSSARNAVYAMLRHKKTKVVEEGNSEIGLPLGLLGLKPRSLGFQTLLASIFDYARIYCLAPFRINNLKKYDFLIIEMGIDEPDPPKNMGYLLTIVKPDISVFLNVHPVHTMQFDKTVPPELSGNERLEKILSNIAAEKGRIITESGCKVAIYNADNKYVADVLANFHQPLTQKLSFGRDTKNNIFYKDFEVNLSGTTFSFGDRRQVVNIALKHYLLPEEYRELIASAILVGRSVGMDYEQIQEAIESNFSLPAGRSSVFDGIHSSVIIDSSYNASKVAVLAFLKLVAKIKGKRKFVFLFGDMRELGRESEAEHKEVAREIEKVVDCLYCVGPQTKQYILPNVDIKDKQWFETSVKAGEYLKEHLPEGAILLVKGSQNTIYLEEAIKPLLADKANISKLCRQSDYWMEVKKSQS